MLTFKIRNISFFVALIFVHIKISNLIFFEFYNLNKFLGISSILLLLFSATLLLLALNAFTANIWNILAVLNIVAWLQDLVYLSKSINFIFYPYSKILYTSILASNFPYYCYKHFLITTLIFHILTWLQFFKHQYQFFFDQKFYIS